MILKEWACKSCGCEFEAPGPAGGQLICPQCGCLAARTFRTPPQIDTQRGHSRSVDRLISNELGNRKIANYSQRFGDVNKITYEQDFSQGHCTPAWGRAGLNKVLQDRYGTGPIAPTIRTLDAAPLAPGSMQAPNAEGKIEWQPTATKNRPTQLLSQTQVIARTDDKGNQIPG